MAETKIEWARYTFNPWRGCTKVSAGCDHCYAETMSHRNPKWLGVWGDDGVRALAAEGYWKGPLRWAAEARALGKRERVFCASLADVGEDRPELIEPRARLCELIRQTADALDWMLLTKRIENMARVFPADVLALCWVGVTTEHQDAFNARAGQLARIRCRVRFLSLEPLLGRIDWTGHTVDIPWAGGSARGGRDYSPLSDFIDLVIVGGESGAGEQTRPMHPAWAERIQRLCARDQIAFFFKQWGDWQHGSKLPDFSGEVVLSDGRHERYSDNFKPTPTSSEWIDLQPTMMARVGKHAAGRELNHREWNEMPEPRA
jgi:protein gp37